jgi:hypothetical protein
VVVAAETAAAVSAEAETETETEAEEIVMVTDGLIATVTTERERNNRGILSSLLLLSLLPDCSRGSPSRNRQERQRRGSKKERTEEKTLPATRLRRRRKCPFLSPLLLSTRTAQDKDPRQWYRQLQRRL